MSGALVRSSRALGVRLTRTCRSSSGSRPRTTNPAASIHLTRKNGPLPPQPFTPEAAPIECEAEGRLIPSWKTDSENLVGKLPASPVPSHELPEPLTLIPMGAARLRITMFPVIASSAGAARP